jgi:hypothetical protein
MLLAYFDTTSALGKKPRPSALLLMPPARLFQFVAVPVALFILNPFFIYAL